MTAAHRIADDERRTAARQRDDVMPVAAHDMVPDGEVSVRDLHGRRDIRLAGKQAPLQRPRGPPLPVIKAGVVDAHRGARGQRGGQRHVTGVEGRACR
jgi:hypothetical protein